MNFKDVKEYHKNPRKITAERFEELTKSLESYGDLGGIIYNRPTNEIIGGNQRTKVFMQAPEAYKVIPTKEYEKPQKDGTLLYGYVVRDEGKAEEQRFSYREVEWTPEICERANIVANKLTGSWDFDMLANSFNVETLLESGFTQNDIFPPTDSNFGMDNQSSGEKEESSKEKESAKKCPNCGYDLAE